MAELRTIVSGRHLLTVDVQPAGQSHKVDLTVRLDGIEKWSSREYEFADLGAGSTERDFFVWVYDRLIVVPTNTAEEVSVFEGTFPIRFVYAVGVGWLVVREVSVQLIINGSVVSEVELGACVLSARWKGEQLHLDCDEGDFVFEVSGGPVLNLVEMNR